MWRMAGRKRSCLRLRLPDCMAICSLCVAHGRWRCFGRRPCFMLRALPGGACLFMCPNGIPLATTTCATDCNCFRHRGVCRVACRVYLRHCYRSEQDLLLWASLRHGATYPSGRERPICLREAQVNGAARLAFDNKLGEELAHLPQSARLMMDCGAHSGAVQSAAHSVSPGFAGEQSAALGDCAFTSG